MTTREQAHRRRRFVALVGAALLVGVLALVWLPGRSEPSAADAPTTPAATSTTATPSTEPPSDRMPPAWLAWISGSLPGGLAGAAADTESLGTTVVVAGDTLWMNESRDAKGKVVSHPTEPYRIPIDAFAVDPREYAPFVPEAYRGIVTNALTDGKALLGTSSAALRKLDVGSTLVFGDGAIQVGAIVPDEVAGWSELLVSRRVGDRLGIVDDRYLLSLPNDPMTERRFARIMAGLIPGTPIRTVAPGGSPYMRIASGVNPPVVMKGVFGEFAAYPRSDDPAFLNMSPLWYDANIRTRTVPLLGTVTCHEELFPALIGALEEVEAAGLGGEIHVYSGCYAARTVARSSTAPPSQHAYGAAIDINAPENPYGSPPTMDPRIVEIFARWGFIWGGNFLTPDGMHFEYGEPAA